MSNNKISNVGNNALLHNSVNHDSYIVTIPIVLSTLDNSRTILLYKQGDYGAMNVYLNSFDWNGIFKENDIDSITNAFYKALYEARDKYVPTKTIDAYKANYPKWFNIELTKNKKGAHKKHKTTHSLSDYKIFQKLRHDVTA